MEKKKKGEDFKVTSELSEDSEGKNVGMKAKLSLQKRGSGKKVAETLLTLEVDLNDTEDFKDGKMFISRSRPLSKSSNARGLTKNSTERKGKSRTTSKSDDCDGRSRKKQKSETLSKPPTSGGDTAEEWIQDNGEEAPPGDGAVKDTSSLHRLNKLQIDGVVVKVTPWIRTCPTCNTDMENDVFERHIKGCLDSFLKAMYRRRDNAEREAEAKGKCREKKREEAVCGEEIDNEVVDDYQCQICQRDLSHLNSVRRGMHVNRCIDQTESKLKVTKDEQLQHGVLDCPMCGKPLKTEAARKVHLKKCAKALGVTTEQMIQVVKVQEKEHQESLTAVQGPQRQIQTKVTTTTQGSKPSRRKAKGPQDEATQLALALSSSLAEEERKKEQALIGQLNLRGIAENTGQTNDRKKSRKKKNAPPAPPPLLLQLTRDEAHSRIAEKVTKLIVPQVTVDDVQITPPPLESRLLDLPGTKVLTHGEGKRQSTDMLWQKTALLEGDLDGDVRSLYYTEALMPPIYVSRIVAGSKLRRVSEIPGRRRSEEMRANQEQAAQEDHIVSPITPIAASTQTAVVLAELAAEGDVDEDVHGGRGTVDVVDAASGTVVGDAVVSADTVTATTVFEDEEDELREASGFCPVEVIKIQEDANTDHLSVRQKAFLAMVDNHLHSDVTIETRSKRIVHAHAVMLAAMCPSLLQLNTDGAICLTDSSKEAVMSLMKYVYAGTVQLQASSLQELKDLAERFNVQVLAKHCQTAQESLVNAVEDKVEDQPQGVDLDTVERERRKSIDHLFQEMLSDSDIEFEPQGDKEADRKKIDNCNHSDEDEDDWREVYCSQRQQLHRLKSLELDDRAGGDQREAGGGQIEACVGNHKKSGDRGDHSVENAPSQPRVCTKVGNSLDIIFDSSDMMNGGCHGNAGLRLGGIGDAELSSEAELWLEESSDDTEQEGRKDNRKEETHRNTEKARHTGSGNASRSKDSDDTGFTRDSYASVTDVGKKGEKSLSHQVEGTCGEDELFSEEEELELTLAVDSSEENDSDKGEQPETKRLPTNSRKRSRDRNDSLPGIGKKKTHQRRSADEFEIVKSGTSTSDDEDPDDVKRGDVQDISKELLPDSSIEASHALVDRTGGRSNKNLEPAKRKRNPSDRDVSDSPVFYKWSSRSRTGSETPDVKSSRKRVKLSTPVHKSGTDSTSGTVLNTVSTPRDRTSSSRSDWVVEQDSLYITPIPKERPRSTFLLVTPASDIIGQSLDKGVEYVVTPVGKMMKNQSGEEIIVGLDAAESESFLAVKGLDSESNTESGNLPNKCGSSYVGESGDSGSLVIENMDLSHLSESVAKSEKTQPVGSGTEKDCYGNFQVDWSRGHKSDSDLEITGDNLHSLTEVAASPTFKTSLKKIASGRRNSGSKHDLSLRRSSSHRGLAGSDELSTNSLQTSEQINSKTDGGGPGCESDVADVWEGFDEMDAGCHFEPFCDADTEESPQKKSQGLLGSSQKKRYSHKRRISTDADGSVRTDTPETQQRHLSDETSRQEADEDHSLPSAEEAGKGEVTVEFEVPGGDSFLWHDDNDPEDNTNTNAEAAEGRQLSQTDNFKTPVTDKPHRPAKKWVPPSPFTPMADYDAMNTPQLKKEVSKFGVRPVGKKRMKILLKDIYAKTHQYETDSDYDGSPKKPTSTSKSSTAGTSQGNQSPTKQGQPSKTGGPAGVFRRPGPVTSTSDTSASEDGSQRSVTSSQESGCSDVPEESFMVDDDEISGSQQGSLADINTKLLQFIKKRPDIHTKMMMYEPLELDWLKKEIQEAGIKCNMQKLMDFLDEKCLTFTMKKMSKRNTNRRQPRKKKKVKVPAAAV